MYKNYSAKAHSDENSKSYINEDNLNHAMSKIFEYISL
jgi:hypothetical protein